MEKVFTLAELVEEYGTEVQKESFKKNGNLNRRSFGSIIKRVEQDWESVKEEGRGSKRKIKCSGKLEDKAMKKDGRVRSGRQQVEHRIPMDIIVATHLEYDMTNQASMSLGKWAIEFGLITELEYDLLRSRHNSKKYQKHINIAVELGIIDEDQTKLLDEFTQYCLEIYGQLAKTLEHMKKCGIILFYENWKGYCKDGKVDINPEIMKKIEKTRRDLMEKHDVVEFNLTAHGNAKKVKNFKREWKEALAEVKDENGNKLGIKYYWKEYAVILKASSKAVQRYLETYCADALEAYVTNKDLFINENEADYVLKRKVNIMKKVEKRHKQKLKEYKEQKITFATTEEEKWIRFFYTQQELEDIIAGYDLGVKRLHLQNLYMERMGQLFELYNIKGYTIKNTLKESLN
ncbi:hypothetical protein [Metabacillus rhizolycopersici]|uniref:Uncharacterized protein n=1 Tax=Metabacillus rhizolycopersici TaxID=2875709 RepID=A0ABS7UXJ0_9BACI|nr:hypothetical protein [Metabacillus rhizolycopersici]MBZ5753036.1 hypothetical protein [Metabacillus rhizolycopersici]